LSYLDTFGSLQYKVRHYPECCRQRQRSLSSSRLCSGIVWWLMYAEDYYVVRIHSLSMDDFTFST